MLRCLKGRGFVAVAAQYLVRDVGEGPGSDGHFPNSVDGEIIVVEGAAGSEEAGERTVVALALRGHISEE